jgi:hypothetical protein
MTHAVGGIRAFQQAELVMDGHRARRHLGVGKSRIQLGIGDHHGHAGLAKSILNRETAGIFIGSSSAPRATTPPTTIGRRASATASPRRRRCFHDGKRPDPSGFVPPNAVVAHRSRIAAFIRQLAAGSPDRSHRATHSPDFFACRIALPTESSESAADACRSRVEGDRIAPDFREQRLFFLYSAASRTGRRGT